MNNFEYKNLTPFKWFVLENFPFIEADIDALTEWQLFCKLGKEINKIINSENILGTQIENITNAFTELENYVNNYFNNLNVQDEINQKLNQMASDGAFNDILQNLFFTNYNNRINNLEGNYNNLEENKIDKNGVEEVKYANLSQEIKEMFTGGNTPVVGVDSVSTSNIVNKSVTPNKTSFLDLLDLMAYSTKTSGYQYNNVISESETQVYTEKIKIQPNTEYRAVHRFVDFYNSEGIFISGVSINNFQYTTDFTFTSPENAYYCVISYNTEMFPDNYLVPLSLNILYTQYGKYKMLNDYSINILKETGKIHYNGFLKDLKNTTGYIESDGSIRDNETLFTIQPIEVTQGDTLHFSRARILVFYNENMEIISYTSDLTFSTTEVEVPENAKYFRGSFSINDLNNGYIYSDNFINFLKYNLTDIFNLNDNCNALPSDINIPVNKDYIIYLDNILPFNKDNFYLKYKYEGILSHFNFNENNNIITLNSNEIINEKLIITVYNRQGKEVSRKTCNINYIELEFKNLTGLFIGDSTIAQQKITENLLEIFNTNNKVLTLLGTKTGTNINNHYEGYSGATVNQFVNNPNFANNVVNPFYNNGFDFTYYMNNNNYNGLDFVVIQLGINDVFGYSTNDFNSNNNSAGTVATNLQKIINSIKTYNNNIKIYVDLIIPPNSNLQTFNSVYKNTKMYWIYKLAVVCQNMYLINSILNAILIDTNIVLNGATDIVDGVHPTNTGYEKMSNTILNYILE